MTGSPRRGVLITRPAPDAADTADRVAARGFDPVIAPVMTVQERAIAPTGRFDAIVITSRNAVPALPPTLHDVRLLAVGRATAARARAAGFRNVLDADGDGAALSALARRRVDPGARVLFAHGYRQGDAVADALAADGFEVVRACAYAVAPAPRMPAAAVAALEADTLHAALFLSTETALAFARLLPRRFHPALAGVMALGIGPGVAAAVQKLPFRAFRVAGKPTLDDVLALL